jgi:hypothetical protein
MDELLQNGAIIGRYVPERSRVIKRLRTIYLLAETKHVSIGNI